jgi:hypothetical protein
MKNSNILCIFLNLEYVLKNTAFEISIGDKRYNNSVDFDKCQKTICPSSISMEYMNPVRVCTVEKEL